MKPHLILLGLIILICISCTGLPAVSADTKNQEPPLLQWYLNNAEVDLGNAKFWLSVYDNALNDTTKLKIYADMVTSYDQANQASIEYMEPPNFNLSLQSGRFAMFLATRSYYRIAVAVAFAHILSAEEEINMTPSYVPPSPDANDSLRQAQLTYDSYYIPGFLQYQFPTGDNWFMLPSTVNGTVARLRDAVEALLFGPVNNTPSVVALADAALKKAELWNETQEPLARKQLLERIGAVNTSFLYSVLPTMGTLLLAMIFVIIKLLSGVVRWAKTIRLPPRWKGQLDYSRGMLLVNAILIGGGFQLANAISQLSSYQGTPDLSFLRILALIGSALGATSVLFILINSPKKPCRGKAILAVALFVLTIVVYLVVTWTLAPVFLRPVQV